MTNKDEKTTWSWAEDPFCLRGPSWLTFSNIAMVAAIVSCFFFPGLIVGIIIYGIYGAASARQSYWQSVGPVRGRNYGNPQHRKDYHS